MRCVIRLKGLCRVALSVSAVCVCLLFSSLAGAEVVARVNDVELTAMDLDDAMAEILPYASFHGRLSPEKKAQYIPAAMDRIVERELLYQEARRQGMKVEKARITEAKEALISRMGGKSEFKRILKERGITEKQYEKNLERTFLAEDVKKSETVDKVVTTPEEVKAYYEKNKADFVRPEARRIRHILISVDPGSSDEDRARKRAVAEDVVRKARSGEDFAQLAWDFSDDPYRVKGGDFGLIHSGRLDPELDKVVFSLVPGNISDPTETIYGYHVIKVEEVKGKEQLNLEDVAQKIEKMIREGKLKALQESFMGGLKAKAKIEVLRK